jgi:hypothetical protein
MRIPASCSAIDSFSGVWPPYCTTQATSPPASCSRAMIDETSSKVSGSKYNRSTVS